MKKIFPFFLALVLLSACEKTINIEIPAREPRLVINGWLQKGELVQARIGKSRHVLQPLDNTIPNFENYLVKNAVPVLYEDNIIIDTLDFDPLNYVYQGDDTLREGHSYRLSVTAPGFERAEATTRVPSQSTIAGVQRNRNARTTSDGVQQDEILIRLNDPAESNFYLVQFFRAPYGSVPGGSIYCVSTTDKDIEPIGEQADPLSTDNCYDGSSLLMRDVNFNGGEKLLRFFIDSYELAENFGPGGIIYRPYVKLSRITEDYFRFVKSYHVYYNSSDNPFAEPSNVYTNVRNGYGSFTGYTMAVDSLR